MLKPNKVFSHCTWVRKPFVGQVYVRRKRKEEELAKMWAQLQLVTLQQVDRKRERLLGVSGE